MRTAIARFLQYLTVERNASAYTIKSYREDLTGAGRLSDRGPRRQLPRPEAITVLELRGYVAAMHEAGYAKTSIARRLASLRSFFKFGQREGWTKTNPAKPLRNPRKGRSLPHFLSAEDIGRLLSAPPANTAMGLRDRAILETMYSAGLRVSETVGLNRGDIDFEDGILRVRGKGRKERLAPIGSYAAAALQKWLAKARLNPREPAGGASAGVPQQVRPPADDAERRPDAGEVPAAHVARHPHHAALFAAQFCHASLGPRGRHPQRAGASGPQEPRDHADLHARQHRRPSRGLREGAPAGEVTDPGGVRRALTPSLAIRIGVNWIRGRQSRLGLITAQQCPNRKAAGPNHRAEQQNRHRTRVARSSHCRPEPQLRERLQGFRKSRQDEVIDARRRQISEGENHIGIDDPACRKQSRERVPCVAQKPGKEEQDRKSAEVD